jgi:hypothetical protein
MVRAAVFVCRGLGADVASSSSEDGSGDDDEDDAGLSGEEEVVIGEDNDVILDESEWGVGAAAGRPQDDKTLIAVDAATRRLAAVDLEWSNMRAVDIFAVLQSFVGGGGAIERVVVYLSDYGRQEREHEKEHGPRGLTLAEVRPESSE